MKSKKKPAKKKVSKKKKAKSKTAADTFLKQGFQNLTEAAKDNKKKTKSKPKTTKMGQEVKKALEDVLEQEKADKVPSHQQQLATAELIGKFLSKPDDTFNEDSIHQDGACCCSECRNEICRMERHLLEMEANPPSPPSDPEQVELTTAWFDSFMAIFGFRRKK
jgi:flagellar biosynthesis GTPase FlhF